MIKEPVGELGQTPVSNYAQVVRGLLLDFGLLPQA